FNCSIQLIHRRLAAVVELIAKIGRVKCEQDSGTAIGKFADIQLPHNAVARSAGRNAGSRSGIRKRFIGARNRCFGEAPVRYLKSLQVVSTATVVIQQAVEIGRSIEHRPNSLPRKKLYNVVTLRTTALKPTQIVSIDQIDPPVFPT